MKPLCVNVYLYIYIWRCLKFQIIYYYTTTNRGSIIYFNFYILVWKTNKNNDYKGQFLIVSSGLDRREDCDNCTSVDIKQRPFLFSWLFISVLLLFFYFYEKRFELKTKTIKMIKVDSVFSFISTIILWCLL